MNIFDRINIRRYPTCIRPNKYPVEYENIRPDKYPTLSDVYSAGYMLILGSAASLYYPPPRNWVGGSSNE